MRPVATHAPLLALLLVTCQAPSPATGPATGPASRPGSEPASRAASVRPGINKDYLDESRSAESYLERFEVESREIYAQRAAIAARVGLAAGQRVADVGAGTGLFLKSFADAV